MTGNPDQVSPVLAGDFRRSSAEIKTVSAGTASDDSVFSAEIPRDLVDSVLDQVGRLLPVQSAVVILCQMDSACVAASRGAWSSESAGQVFNLKQYPILNQLTQMTRPLIIPDVESYGGPLVIPGLAPLRAIMAAPVFSGGTLAGFLAGAGAIPFSLGDEHSPLFQFCADHLGQLLEERRKAEELRRSSSRLESVYRANSYFTSSLNISDRLYSILLTLFRLFKGLQRACIFVYDADELVHTRAMWADGRTMDPGFRLERDGFHDLVMRRHELMASHQPQPPETVGVLTLGLPLQIADRRVGVLSLNFSNSCEPAASREQMLRLLAHPVAVAIENAMLFGRVDRRIADMNTLFAVTSAAASASGLPEMARRLAAMLRTWTNALVVVIYYPEYPTSGPKTAGVLRAAASEGFPLSLNGSLDVPLNDMENALALVAAEQEPVMITDINSQLNYNRLTPQTTTAIILPLVSAGELAGLIALEYASDSQMDANLPAPMLTLSGTLASVVRNARLYTDLKETERRFNQIAENINEVFWLIEPPHNRMIYVSPAFERVFGRSSDEVHRSPLFESWVHTVIADDRAELIRQITAAPQNPDVPHEYEFRILRPPDDSVRWIRMVTYPVYNEQGERYRVAAIAEDTTDRKLVEERSRELIIEREKVRLLREFVSDASHDLKTPLSVLQTSLHLLRRKYPDFQNRHIDALEDETKHLIQLVEDLLAMSRLDAGEAGLELESVDVNTLIYRVVAEQKPLVSQRGHRVNLALDANLAHVRADLSELSRAISNLFINAVNYTPDQGAIAIRTSMQDGHVVIEISDTGIGISPDDLPRIFERFYRADKARQTLAGGTGLGLSIVRKVIESHGGSVDVQSEEGRGSTFRVMLPVPHPRRR